MVGGRALIGALPPWWALATLPMGLILLDNSGRAAQESPHHAGVLSTRKNRLLE